MFCTYCKQARIENQAPCPNCGAPSPLLQISNFGQCQWDRSNLNRGSESSQARQSGNRPYEQTNSWGGPGANSLQDHSWGQPFSPFQQQSPSLASHNNGNFQSPQGTPQFSFDPGASMSPSPNTAWSQMSPMPQQETNRNEMATSTALVPINNSSSRQSTVTLQLIPQQAIEHLLPALPETPETIYVRPLFTKPRPLIPRYRIFSGAISLLIVVLLLCGGTSYYAKASGTIDRLTRAFTGGPPTVAITPTPVVLADPPNKIDAGPAIGIIPSGTTTLHIDQNQNALEQDNKFTVGQVFYVTYNVQPPQGQSGKVTAKWYQNGQYWKTSSDDKTTITESMNGYIMMVYVRPAAGSVEIYWNDQLALRLYFVVRPATN
jgi:hypothetical protein